MFLIFLPALLLGQSRDNSPFSRFGFGDIQDDNFIYSRNMGGLGAAIYNPYEINIVNPASINYLSAAAFDIGFTGDYNSLTDQNGQNASFWAGNLSYISLAFPLKNTLNDLLDRKQRPIFFGMAFTLKPFSNVDYNIENVDFIEGVGRVERNLEGSGGTFDFTWSNSFRYKNLSVGINTGVLLGRTQEQRLLNFPDTGLAESTLIEEVANHRGFLWRVGLLYTVYLSKRELLEDNTIVPERKFVFGVHGNSQTNLSTDLSEFAGAVILLGNGDFLRDTLSFTRTEGLSGKLPSEFGAGVTYYSSDKFAAGVNYTVTNWSGFSSEAVNEDLNDATELSIGGFYRPNINSVNSYFSRIKYRLGAYYKQVPTATFINADGPVDDIGLTVGFSLPFFYQRKISHAHLGFGVGVRGRNTNIEERYFRATFSFTYSDDEWFLKRKYN